MTHFLRKIEIPGISWSHIHTYSFSIIVLSVLEFVYSLFYVAVPEDTTIIPGSKLY